MNLTAFILGNGLSRKRIDMHQLKKHGVIFGCNGLYKEFSPDVLVAYDEEMTREIEESGYAKSNVFYSKDANIKAGSILFENIPNNNSGACASYLAASFGFQTLYLLGFDLLDINNEAHNLYGKSSKIELSFWNVFDDVYAKFRSVKFVRVSDSNNDVLDWSKHKNYSRISVNEFNRIFNLGL